MKPGPALVPAVLSILASACRGGDDGTAGSLPPGQRWTEGFPVYSFAGDMELSRDDWTLAIGGLVTNDTTLDWDAFTALGPVTDTLDFHCVTGWSRASDAWTGIPSSAILSLVQPSPEAVSVMVRCADGYSTNVLLEDFAREGVMLAYEFQGSPLSVEHGFPVRLIVPHLYAYKAAKWVTGLEFLPEDIEGYWESRGYHVRGDPWLEQRFEGDE
jgi:DMSO/TMAO reductase YedYZ molybdopterin-dependent catalytic subunit